MSEVLAAVPDYADWWPQIRSVTPAPTTPGRPDSARVVARSLLPVPLRLTLVAERVDHDAGVLLVGLHGDLEGFARFDLEPGPGDGTTRARYHQEVEVAAAHLSLPARVLPWLARANHAWMMRGGRRGLTRYLRD